MTPHRNELEYDSDDNEYVTPVGEEGERKRTSVGILIILPKETAAKL